MIKNWWDFLSVTGIKQFDKEEKKVSHINTNAPHSETSLSP